jgi:RNA polymerase sigma factor (sigma-70 family)
LLNRDRPGSDNGSVVARQPEHILDELLVLASQDGDARALEALVRRYQQRLLRHAQRLTGSVDAAGDVTQETWLAIARGLRRLDDPARFRAWAFRILTHKAADWIRKRQRGRALQKSVESREPRPGSSDLENESAGHAAGTTSRLRSAIAQLSPELQAVIGLHYGEGLSMAEIAHVLGVPDGTVKSRLHAARSRLRQSIERSEP